MNDSLPENMEVDDDVVSLASTIEEDILSTEEWEVKDILAEGEVDGTTKYLIEWDGYPLHAASWEPTEHLAKSTIADWEQRKKKDGHKRQSNQRIKAWRKAVIDNVHAKMARHEERNRKRAARGLSQTVYENSVEQYLEDLEGLPTGEEDEGTPFDALRVPRAQGNSTGDSENSPRSHPTPTTPPAKLLSDLALNHQSNGIGTGRAHETQPKPSKTTLGAKFGLNKPKKLSLEPSQTQPIIHRMAQETNNVFSGGKVRKKRPTLMDAATDPTKAPKMLKLRLTNKLDKGFRDREGVVAPNKRPNLFYINPEQERLATQTNASSSTAPHSHYQEAPLSAGTSRQSEISPNSPTAAGDGIAKSVQKKKKKKTVCFLDEPETIEPDPETSLFMDDACSTSRAGQEFIHPKEESNDGPGSLFGLPPGRVFSSPQPVEKMVVSPSTGGTIAKFAKFSPSATSLISLTFHVTTHGIASNSLAKIETDKILIFTHKCIAKDFWQQYGSHSGSVLRGRLTSGEHTGALQNVANRLKLGSFGLMCCVDELLIIVHATNSEDWVSASQALDGETLSFIVIKAGASMTKSDLAPLPCFAAPPDEDLPPGMRPAIFRRIFGFEYNRLLPTSLHETTKHSFFLAFPPTHGQEAIFLAQWLRSCNAECRIQTSLHAGHWFNFLGRDRGVVIIHEDAAWAIRLFPGFAKLLESKPKRFSFWLFSMSNKPQPLLHQWDDSHSAALGDIRLQSIFAVGVVILITPSFLISQPSEAYIFAKWIWKIQKRDVDPYQRARFVVCAGIEDWLYELAVERAERHPSKLKKKNFTPELFSNEAIEAGFKTWQIIRKLVVEGCEDVSSQLIFAPDSIDGNDEQSLVNWFGWWSIMNMSQFRKFIVLGSSDGPPERLLRFFQAPVFCPSTIGNPDEVYRQLDQKEQSSSTTTHGSTLQIDARNSDTPLGVTTNDQSTTLISHLEKLLAAVLATKWCPLVLYKFPVSYWKPDMNFHFRDYKSDFATYNKCFNWFNAFRDYSSQLNTMTAMFYTIEGHWDANTYPQGVMPPRRPWILMHRPVNLHRKPWSASELLIWDLTRNDNFSRDQFVYEEDLIEAQREAIQIFQHENEKKNPHQPIRRAMIGGFDASWMGYTNQLDATLMQLRKFIEDPKYWIPIPENVMADRGWKIIKPGKSPQRPPADDMDIDQPEEVSEATEALQMKTIFHPPRGKGGTSTKCQNRLYQCTKEVLRKTGKGASPSLHYNFRPTLDWYRDQLAEGRGFEHIKVMPWQSLFEHYEIPTSNEV